MTIRVPELAMAKGMAAPIGSIDCDVHPSLPSTTMLLPYLDEHWREQVVERGIDGMDSACFPPMAPANGRPDWRLSAGKPGSNPRKLVTDALDMFGSRYAILNCLYGVQAVCDEYLAAGLASGINGWLVKEWLDFDPRLRASIVIAPENPEFAAKEIERRAVDGRFVQVLLLSMAQMPLGRRFYWPIYEAAARHDLPIAIHAGSGFRHAMSASGWPSYLVEDYVNYPDAFGVQILSLIAEGVCTKFPDLKFVISEGGFTWLPGFLWRANKSWRAMRVETPWIDRPPSEIIRSNFRFTLQPNDLPVNPDVLQTLLHHIVSDEMILFSTDYPHWHFNGVAALPKGLTTEQIEKICIGNPFATYPRLRKERT